MLICALPTETAVLANSLKEEGFTIIATCPGWVATDMGSGSNDVCSYLLLLFLLLPREGRACLSCLYTDLDLLCPCFLQGKGVHAFPVCTLT